VNRRCPLLALLLLLGAVGACAAAEIVLSAPQSEYFFQVGEEAEITLDVDNRGGTNVPGMLTVAVVPADAAQGGGRTQTKSLTIFRDMTTITVDAGAPDAPATFTLKVSFTGSDGQTAVLPEILIHFLGETSSIPATEPAAQVTSSAAASPGVQAQSGGTAIDRAVQAGQTVQDAAVLREAMAAEDRAAAAATEDLLSRAMADPTVADLDGRLRAEGFARTGNTADPAAGTFLFSYQRDGGTGAQISGAMDDDLRFARLDTAASLDVPALLAENETFYDYMSQLTTEGLPRGGTTINATHQSEQLAFSFGEGAAFINATIADSAVQEVSLQRRFNWIPFAALMVGLVGAFALAMRRRQMGGPETPEHESPADGAPSPAQRRTSPPGRWSPTTGAPHAPCAGRSPSRTDRDLRSPTRRPSHSSAPMIRRVYGQKRCLTPAAAWHLPEESQKVTNSKKCPVRSGNTSGRRGRVNRVHLTR